MTDKTQPTVHAEITAPISADLRGIEQEASELPEPSPTAGMNLGQRILHVGGRENAAGYIEFGSVAAVRALVSQVLRDRHAAQPARECLHLSAESARWYSVSSSGMATLCADEADARATAEDSDMIFPRFAPHTAVQLAPLKAAPAPAQAVAVPEGWKLVPINDTPAMWTAGGRAIKSCGGHERDAASLAYKAMVEAAPPAQEHATQLAGPALRPYISHVQSVADLVNNLLLLDQSLPIYGAQYIEHPPGKRRAIAVPPTVSREQVKDSRWIGEGDTLNAAVIWTRAEQPAAPAQAQEDARDAGRWRHFSARGVFPKNVWNNGNGHWQYGEIRALTAEGVADAAIASSAEQGGA